MLIERYIDPYTGEALEKDSEGNLCRKHEGGKFLIKSYDGCYDFVTPYVKGGSGEKEHYDKEHSENKMRKLTLDLVRGAWFNITEPWYKTLLESLGELSGKIILLLGNGRSQRELYFLHLGAGVVFTDLSIEAVKHIKHEFDLSELSHSRRNAIEFHVVDGMHLPFPDQTFDIIYGSAFVHHLDNLDAFFSEVYRCLKKDAICRFLDQADSTIWEGLKRTILRPLQLYSYWKYPRSPEDLRAARRGDVFEKGALIALMKKHHFRELIFIREWFFLAIAVRHYGKSVQWRAEAMKKARPLFLLMRRADIRLSRTQLMKKNHLMLVWGFNK